MVAPTSSTINSPLSVGQSVAMAGRSIGAMVCRQNFAIAISAPVFPAETAQAAAPVFTASIACHIEETRRPARNAWLGLSLILTAMSVWKTSDRSASRGWRASNGWISFLVAIDQKVDVRTPFERNRGSGEDDDWAGIASHRIQRYPDFLRHSLVRPAPRAPQYLGPGSARRDNTRFGAQGNAAPPSLDP